MSDILIRGMEMPTSCAVCGWGSYVGNGKAMCLKTGITEKTDIMSNRRPEWCPLVEIETPYGDLIDRDALIDTLSSSDRDIYVKCILEEDATVVIEGNMDGNKVMK